MKNNSPRGYIYLLDAKDRDPKDVMDNHVFPKEKTIIIRDELKRLYFAFDNYQQFAEQYPEDEVHLCHEVITKYRPRKIIFDIDCKGELEDKQSVDEMLRLDSIERAIHKFNMDYCPWAIVHKIDSSGPVTELDGTKYYKTSCHIVIDALVTNNEIMKTVAEYVQSLIDYPGAKELLDMSIYKSIQNFRTPCSTKNGRMLVPEAHHNRQECMVTGKVPHMNPITKQWVVNYLEVPAKSALGKLLKTQKGAKIVRNGRKKITDKYINDVVEKIKILMPGWDYRENKRGYLIFNRTYKAKTGCDICKRHHTNDNTFRATIADSSAVFRHCARSPTIHKLLIAAKDSIPRAIYYAKKKYNDIDITSKCEFKKLDIYNSNAMSLITAEHRTIYLRANMKMGKTKVLIDYLRGFKRVVIISFRRTFTDDKLSELKKYGFKSYNDIEGEINLGQYSRIIIQLESLHRIVDDVKPHLVIMDESESIFDQFSSSTIRNINETHVTFNWLVSSCKSLLALDANLDLRTIEVLRYYRGTDDELFIHNKYKNFAGDVIKPVTNNTFQNKIIEAAKGGKNIIIPTNSKEFADTINGLIRKEIDPSKVLKITSDTPEKDKTEIFADVNASWSKYQVVIYTPTCSAGVSFTQEHFDTCYAYFTNCSTSVETARQMLYRARNIRTREYYVHIKEIPMVTGINIIEDVEKLYENISYMRSKGIIPDCQYTYGGKNKYSYVKDGLYKIWLWNRLSQIQSQCHFIPRFYEQSISAGAQIDISEYKPEDKSEVNKAYDKIKIEIKEAEYEEIANTEDIDSNQYDEIMKTGTKTTYERNVKKRYKLRKKYRYNTPKPIDKNFVKTYAPLDVQIIYKNLRDILQSNDHRISIQNIKEYEDSQKETTTLNKKFIQTTSVQHEIAIKLLNICGFDGIMDKKEIKREDIIRNINNYKEFIMNNSTTIYMLFNHKRPISNWNNISSLLRYVNGITVVLYGCKVMAKSKLVDGKDLFMIKHNYLGNLFPLVESENKPYIEPNHMYNNIVV
jgi:hypothetical protein